MARTIDDRVVSASFETSKFESGVSKMLSGIDRLKKAIDFKNAGKGLDQINASANRVNLSHISNGVDAIKGKLGALRLAAIATFAGIASRAVGAGAQFVKSFTFQPVMDGLHEYQTNLNSVQTILANTQASGAKLKDVNGALNELNRYSDKTIYNFSEMAKNIGTFTAAGVDLKTSTASIKGIANLAALSGSNSQQASTAMYQLSQAIASGRVSLQDWNSVVNAGMGGTVFQRALAQTAEKMGTLDKGAVSLKGKMKNVSIAGQSFRESIQAGPGKKSWLTSDVLTKTLQHFTGDLTDAQLKAEGFNEAEIKAIQQQAKTAMNAATQVKTLGQVFDVAKETMGSGWAQTFQTIFGDFGEAKTTFTALSNAINGFINTNANARNKVLADWKALGGRKILIDSLKGAFHDLTAVVKPIHDAFRDVFPPKTGKDLFTLTQRFANLVKALKPSAETVNNLHKTFRGLFAVIDIGKMVIGGIFSVIAKLFGALGSGSGGILKLTGSWGDWVFALDQSLKKTGAINKFFGRLGTILQTPILLLKALGHAFASAFSGDKIGAASKSLGPLEKIIDGLTRAWDKFVGSVGSGREIIQPALDGISQMFGALGQTIADALKGANFDAIFKVLEVSLLGGIFLTLRKTLSGGLGNALAGGVLKSIVQAFTGVGGLTKSIGGTFNALTGSIQTMQQNVKSDTLKNIAISIALLSASIIGLSLVDPKRLNGALTAITIGFGQLLGAMAIMDKIGKSGGFIKMPVIAASMVILAAAIDLLAIAVAGLSRLSWEELAKGLGAVTVLLAGISAASVPLSKNSAGLIRAGLGITVIAVAMNILARAVKSFGSMDVATLAKGIGGIAIALAGIGAASRLFPSGMVSIGVGLIAIGVGLKLLAGSVERMGKMDMKILAKGIGSIAIALGLIGLAMRAMPGPSMVITAAGLLLVAISLKGIAKAIQSFGGMSITEIAKGLGTLAGALTILTVALYAMSGTLAGSAALAVAAAAIAVLAPALKSLGDQSWGQIIKGMVALAAAFALLGVAGIVLAPVAPAILALGAALIAVGAGLALAGAGVALIGIGLASIAVAGPAAVKILVSALTQLAESLPKVIQGLVKALLQLVTSVADAAPKFVKAMGKILAAMAQAIILATPQLEKAIEAILTLIFKVIRNKFPDLVKTGFEMLKALLKGIANNIAGVVKMVVTIIGKLTGAIVSNLGKIISAGAQILAAILKGIANGIAKVATAALSIVTKFLQTIASNVGKVVTAGGDIIAKFLRGIGNNISSIVTEGGRVVANFIKGIGNAGAKIVSAGVTAASKFVRAVAKGAVKMADEGAKAVIKFLNGVADVIDKREPQMLKAGGRIGAAIVRGMINGIGSLAGELKRKAEKMISDLPGKALKILHIKSPSQVFFEIGQNIVLGLATGITDTSAVATTSMATLAVNTTGAFTQKFGAEQGKILEQLYGVGTQAGVQFFAGLLGIVESNDTVDQAMKELTGSLASQIDETSKAIQTDRDNIKQAKVDISADIGSIRQARKDKDKGDLEAAQKSKKEHEAAEAAAKKSLKANLDLLSVLKGTADYINNDKSFDKQRLDLKQLTADFGAYTQAIDDAKQKLADLEAEKASFVSGKFDQFSALPDIVATDENGDPIDPATQVTNYTNSLSAAGPAVTNFTNTLDQLRTLGLNDETYKQLLDVGPAAQGFADSLLTMGPAAIKAINDADTSLRGAAKTMADHAGASLYDNMLYVGDQSAKGILDGLTRHRSEIYQAMIKIATDMIRAIKKKLKIKSPSQVFAEVGSYSMEGMAQGFTNSSKLVTDAIYGVSDDAKAAIKQSMSGISDIVNASINPDPTITPILDLSQIQAGASQMSSLLDAPTTLALASGISVPGSGEDPSETGQAAAIQFIQNNTSPESLSSIEIYRQTKNQLAQARPVLAK